MPATLIVVLDSNEYIFGIGDPTSESAALLDALATRDWQGTLVVATPWMVEREVVRNLSALAPMASRTFYFLLAHAPWDGVTYTDPPSELVLKYLDLGLAEEDAIIAAFAEMVNAQYLVSENRHFLERLKSDAFQVVNAAAFLEMVKTGT